MAGDRNHTINNRLYRIIVFSGYKLRIEELNEGFTERDEIVEGEGSIEIIAEEVFLKVKQHIFTDDEDANSVCPAMSAFIEWWFKGPAYNENWSIAQCETPEGCITILSEASKYFNYSEEDIYDNWKEICREVKW
jgi:hypothetical protein